MIMSVSNSSTRPPRASDTLVIGISSRALFDLRESHEVFETQGLRAYAEYQVDREDEFLRPGVAFPLAQKLLALNEDGADHPPVEVILLSRNSADTGLRIFNTIEHFGLRIERAAFTNGASPWKYMEAFGADLLLSTNAADVRRALEAGYAAATILPGSASNQQGGQLRIAFDGDAVVFSDEAERIYQERGLEAFADSERQAANQPLSGGPFKHVPEWGIRIDEALFLGGRSKGEFLKAFGADIFFDDQQVHVDSAKAHVASAHVPSGVVNEAK